MRASQPRSSNEVILQGRHSEEAEDRLVLFVTREVALAGFQKSRIAKQKRVVVRFLFLMSTMYVLSIISSYTITLHCVQCSHYLSSTRHITGFALWRSSHFQFIFFLQF